VIVVEVVRITIRGIEFEVTREDIIKAARRITPERITRWYVEIEGVRYPIKQVVAEALGLRKLDFTTADAKRLLEKLGFKPERM